MSFMRRQYSYSYSYSRMEKEDPEEQKHRKAQFLIYKALKAADSPKRRSCSGLRACKLMRIKMGRKLMCRLRKKLEVTFSGVHRQLSLWRHVA